MRRDDGAERWLLASAAPSIDANGELQGAISFFRDITETHEREIALDRCRSAPK